MSAAPAAPQQEAWLTGPVDGVDPFLMPAAHALVQARRDLQHRRGILSSEQFWRRAGGAAPVGFHLRHIAGSTDRLLTYARGAQLDEGQRAALQVEQLPGDPPEPPDQVFDRAITAIDTALDVIRRTPRDALLEPREVGQGRLPSNVLGLLFHIAEHTTRHVGQAITTAKVVVGQEDGS
jgi:hypothetical protein